MKKCGLVIRVSTDRQAKNEEGYLTTQLQRLRAQVQKLLEVNDRSNATGP